MAEVVTRNLYSYFNSLKNDSDAFKEVFGIDPAKFSVHFFICTTAISTDSRNFLSKSQRITYLKIDQKSYLGTPGNLNSFFNQRSNPIKDDCLNCEFYKDSKGNLCPWSRFSDFSGPRFNRLNWDDLNNYHIYHYYNPSPHYTHIHQRHL